METRSVFQHFLRDEFLSAWSNYQSMSPFWGSFFEHLRGCGRNAALFLLAIAALFVGLVVCVIASHSGLFQYAPHALAGILIVIAMWFCLGLQKIRKRRRERFYRRPLSSDEARVARSKLLKERKMNGPQQQY